MACGVRVLVNVCVYTCECLCVYTCAMYTWLGEDHSLESDVLKASKDFAVVAAAGKLFQSTIVRGMNEYLKQSTVDWRT